MYEDDYLWRVSGIYLTGLVPAVALMMVWSVTLVLSMGCFFYIFKTKGSSTDAQVCCLRVNISQQP